MTVPQRLTSPYLLIFLIPTALFMIIDGALNLTSLLSLQHDHATVRQLQGDDFESIVTMMRLAQEIGEIQSQATAALQQSAGRSASRQDSAKIHSDLLDRIGRLENTLPDRRLDPETADAIRAELRTFRAAILFAPSEPGTGAAELARRIQLVTTATTVVQDKIGATVLNRASGAMTRGEIQAQSFEDNAIANLTAGGLLSLALLTAWCVAALLFSHRISALTNTLRDLAIGEIDPPDLPLVRTISQGKGVALRDLARIVLSLRESVLARHQAQFNLGKRMKELSCLYDVSRLTELDKLGLAEMLEAVANRLPLAMRYPELAHTHIVHGDLRIGPVPQDECLRACFVGRDGITAELFISYHGLEPHLDGPRFLAEEITLIEAVADRLGLALDRRRIIAAERDNHQLMQAIFDSSPNAIDVIDPVTATFVRANAESCRLLGYSREELLSRGVADIEGAIPPQEVPVRLRAMLAWDGGQSETVYRRKDGRLIPVHLHVNTMRQNGRDYLVTLWHDITAEKRARAEIRKLSLVVEQTPQPVVITNLDASIEYVNDAFLHTTGFSRGEVIGRDANIIKSGLTPPETYQSMWAALTAGQSWRGELINQTRDGKELIEAVLIVPLHQDDGQITHYVALKENITEKKHLQQELERHRHHLEQLVAERTQALATINQEQQALFDAANTGIVLLKNRTIISSNRRLDEIFGCEPGEQLGQSTRQWFQSEAEWLEQGTSIYAAMWRGETHVFDTRLLRKDGTLFWARLAGRALDPQDPSKGIVEIVEDITAERTSMEDIEAARALAEDAARVKSDFLANMSHEIRTPMNAIIGLTHLLQRSVSNPRHADHLAKISSAAHHLLDIINDILDLSKIEANKMTVESSDFDLDAVITNLCDLIADKADSKGIELVVQTHAVPPVLHGDGLRLGQILLNFASNAVKFTERGSVIIRAAVIASTATGVTVRFEVSDSGIGLPPDQQARLFLPFEQGDRSTTRKFGGTGLGLAISRRLTELMGGRIGVESRPGLGSTFWIELPLQQAKDVRRVRDRPSIEPRGRRALVVDDLPEAVEAHAGMLTMFGFNVHAAGDGPSALTALTEAEAAGTPFDLLLVDWRMPEMDGVAVCHRLRTMALDSPPVRMLVCAGYDDVPPDTIIDTGIALVLHKPLTPSRLFDAIQTVSGGTSPPATAIPPPDHLAEWNTGRHDAGHILLAEDNPINQDVALELLSGIGLVVDLAENGQVAVDKAAATAYDLILMDMQMPVMDGLTATRLIRAMPRHAATPILAMTANAFDKDRQKCLDAGMNDHVAKPVDPNTLFRTLLRWLPGAEAETRPIDPAAATGLMVTRSNHPGSADETMATLRDGLGDGDDLDLDTGLRSVRGQAGLYLHLLNKFLDGDEITALTTALGRNDLDGALRAAHTLKGTAATLGARDLGAIAADIEAAMVDDDAPPTPTSLTALAQELGSRFAAWRTRIRLVLAPTAELAAEADDGTAIETVIAQLIDLLESDDIAAAALFRDQRPRLRAVLGNETGRMARLIDGFAFDQALVLLRKIATGQGAAPAG